MSEREFSFGRILQDIRRRRGPGPICITVWVVGIADYFAEGDDWELLMAPNGVPCGCDTLIMTSRYSQRYYIPLDKIAALSILSSLDR
jgi:hypothetical protein